MIIATLNLTMDDKGRVEASGPLNNQAQCYAMLQLGMDIVRAYNPAATQGPAAVFQVEPGEPAIEIPEGPCTEAEKIRIVQAAQDRGAKLEADLTDAMFVKAKEYLAGGHYPNDVVTVVEREAAEAEPAPVEDSKLSALKDLASF